MKIALVSYEYPPDTAFGGIATYIEQAATLLVGRGHSVEVFASSAQRNGHFKNGKVVVNLIGEMNRRRFAAAIAPIFSQRHAICKFDVVESPEYFADGLDILRRHPETAHIVKLHTPSQLIRKCNSCSDDSAWLRHNISQVRGMAAALRRGRRPPPYESYQSTAARQIALELLEKDCASECGFVTAPSRAMAEWAIREWGIDRERVTVVPNPYIPAGDLLSIPIAGNNKVVGFFGRLEYRKGVCDLVDAIPTIIEAEPSVSFRFVGSALYHPVTHESFEVYILRKLKRLRSSITIVGPKSLQEMPAEYSKVDICVFPSIWENFPNVCLEAMSAGKAIVASNAGGMTEMLDSNCGSLIPPRDAKGIADSVIRLLRSDDLRMQMGCISRRRVLDRYSVERIGPQMEMSYRSAISRSHPKVSNSLSTQE